MVAHNKIAVTPEMFSSKIDRLRTAVDSLQGEDLHRAYQAVSLLSDNPHLFDVRDGLRLPESPNFVIQTEICGPEPKPPSSGSIPILISRAGRAPLDKMFVLGPVSESSSVVAASCPHCHKDITIALK